MVNGKDKLDSYNWQEIQLFYDQEHTWREVCNKFKVGFNMLSLAAKQGLFISRNTKTANALVWKRKKYKGRRHTPESKKKISDARKAYLAANPDKCSWKTTNKFVSIPCEKLKNELKNKNIPFQEEIQPLLHIKRFYSVDILFPDYGAIIEVNGNQHYDTNGNLRPYYQERHDLLTQNGWRVFEIPYHVAMRNNILDELLIQVFSIKSIPNTEYRLYKKKEFFCSCGNRKWRTSILCRNCHDKSGIHRKRKIEWPSKEHLHWLIWNFPMIQIAKMYGISDKSIKKWCLSYQINTPQQGYWNKMKIGLIIDYQI